MASSTIVEATVWPFSKKFIFRLFFILLVLYITFNNNGAFPFFDILVKYPNQWMAKFIPWFSVNVVHYTYDFTITTNGSGDTSYDYILLLFIASVSFIGAVVWSVLDYKRKNYNTLYYWLLVLVRCFLAFTLINYGMWKLIKLQFPYPSLTRLTQPYGDSSPMGLAWTFLGFSKGYNIFMGIIEVSAILVLFRKTMVIGAFLALAASAHVMSMNYFYDVPVKILSTSLVVMSIFILAPYLQKIGTFFLTNNAVSLKIIEAPSYKKKFMYYGIYVFKYIAIVYFLYALTTEAISASSIYGEKAKKPPLYGIYKTEKFMLNNVELPPLTTDSVRWSEMIVSRTGLARIKKMNDSIKVVTFIVDSVKKQINYNTYPVDSTKAGSLFTYRFIDKDRLLLSGKMDNDSINVILKIVDLKRFKLINRKFNWINEYPYNR